jgi:hypothetical protein
MINVRQPPQLETEFPCYPSAIKIRMIFPLLHSWCAYPPLHKSGKRPQSLTLYQRKRTMEAKIFMGR